MSESSLPDPTHTLRVRVDSWWQNGPARRRYLDGLSEHACPALILLATTCERSPDTLLARVGSAELRGALAILGRESAPAAVRADLSRHGLSKAGADWLLGSLGARLLTGHLVGVLAPLLVRAGGGHVDAVEAALAALRRAYPDGGGFSRATADWLRVAPLRGLEVAAGGPALERARQLAASLGFGDQEIRDAVLGLGAYADAAQGEVLQPGRQARGAEWDQVVPALWEALARPHPRTDDEHRHGVGLRAALKRARTDAKLRKKRGRDDGGRSGADVVADEPLGSKRVDPGPGPALAAEMKDAVSAAKRGTDSVEWSAIESLAEQGKDERCNRSVGRAIGKDHQTAKKVLDRAIRKARRAID